MVRKISWCKDNRSLGRRSRLLFTLRIYSIALIKVDTPQPTEFTTKGSKKNSYYNFVVDDIEAVHQQFKDNGIVTSEIDQFDEMKFFDFYDLDGNPFSVVNEVESSPYHSDHIRKLQEQDIKNGGVK